MNNHEGNRKKVCILCLSNNRKIRPVSSAVKKVIGEYYLKDIDNRAWYYPSSICTTCRVNCNPDSGNPEGLHLYKYQYDHIQITRSTNKCTCEVCKAAETIIGKNLPGFVSPKARSGRPRKKEAMVGKVTRMCKICLTEIKRGKKHICNFSQRTENLSNILKADNSPSKASEAAVFDFVAEKSISSGK